MLDRDAILDEANDIADADEAVGSEAIEITFDVVKQHVIGYLRGKKIAYEANSNHISAMTIDAILKEVNNA